MRFLGISETCDLGSMYLRLLRDGHEVRISVSEALAQGTMNGLVPRVGDWRNELDWIRAAGSEGIILFEAVGFGTLQDELRQAGLNVIGGSALGDRLENDRSFALDLLGRSGLRSAPLASFATAEDAIADLIARPRRCVFKMNQSAGETFVGTMADGSDVTALLRANHTARSFILMDFVDGIETGIGAYFDGNKFLRPACLDWEHKRFFAGDLGELTGEMGTVATFDASDILFEATLKPLEPMLRRAKHVGYVNLNTIINQDGIWPLEFTCRFGYPGFSVLEPLQRIEWGDLLRSMITGKAESFPTAEGFCTGIVVTTPPFPYSRKEIETAVGLPIVVGAIPADHLHLGEVGLFDEHLVTSGVYGWTAVVTGTGPTIEESQSRAYANIKQLSIPNMRYRLDIGERLAAGNYKQLRTWGWLGP